MLQNKFIFAFPPPHLRKVTHLAKILFAFYSIKWSVIVPHCYRKCFLCVIILKIALLRYMSICDYRKGGGWMCGEVILLNPGNLLFILKNFAILCTFLLLHAELSVSCCSKIIQITFCFSCKI